MNVLAVCDAQTMGQIPYLLKIIGNIFPFLLGIIRVSNYKTRNVIWSNSDSVALPSYIRLHTSGIRREI